MRGFGKGGGGGGGGANWVEQGCTIEHVRGPSLV